MKKVTKLIIALVVMTSLILGATSVFAADKIDPPGGSPVINSNIIDPPGGSPSL